MTAALILAGYALAVAVLAPPLLAHHWPSDRAPHLTVTLLQILTCSFLVAAVGAGLAPAFTLVEGLSELSPALTSCADQFPITDHGSLGTVLGHLGWISATLLSTRLLYCLAATFGTARRRRRAHSRMLHMLATRDDELGVLILDHPSPACYCLPKHRPPTNPAGSATARRFPADQPIAPTGFARPTPRRADRSESLS